MVLLSGRVRGWRGCHPLHFALQESGGREAGGGARAPKAAAKRLPLRRGPAQAVASLPCPSPRHRPVVRASSANGADRIRRLARSGWKSPPQRPPDHVPGAVSGSTRGGVTRQGSGAGQTRGRRWPPPFVPVKGERLRGRLAGAEPRALLWGCETLDFNQQSPSVAKAERVSDSSEESRSTGSIGSTVTFFPCRCTEATRRHHLANSGASANSRGPRSSVHNRRDPSWSPWAREPSTRWPAVFVPRARARPRGAGPVGDDLALTRALRFRTVRITPHTSTRCAPWAFRFRHGGRRRQRTRREPRGSPENVAICEVHSMPEHIENASVARGPTECAGVLHLSR